MRITANAAPGMRALPVTLLIAVGVLAGSCDSPRSGEPASEQNGERRVISLAPSITRILRALGADDHVVGADAWSLESLGLEGVASVGGLYAPDLERTVELRPTLVLAVASEQQRPFLAVLEARGVRVESIDPYTLDEHLASIESIGGWVGLEEDARALVVTLRRELDEIRARADAHADSRAGRPSVALVVERDPLYVVGRGSFVHELIEIAGGSNAFADLASPFPAVSLEVLAVRAPDILIDATAAYWSGARGGSEANPSPASEVTEEARRFWRRFVPETRVEVLTRPEVTLPGAHLATSARLLEQLVSGTGS